MTHVTMQGVRPAALVEAGGAELVAVVLSVVLSLCAFTARTARERTAINLGLNILSVVVRIDGDMVRCGEMEAVEKKNWIQTSEINLNHVHL